MKKLIIVALALFSIACSSESDKFKAEVKQLIESKTKSEITDLWIGNTQDYYKVQSSYGTDSLNISLSNLLACPIQYKVKGIGFRDYIVMNKETLELVGLVSEEVRESGLKPDELLGDFDGIKEITDSTSTDEIVEIE